MAWLTTDLLADVRRRGGLSDSGGRLSTEDLLAFGDKVIRTQIVPFLRSLREDFILLTEVTALVDGQADYPLPLRAAGSSIETVEYVDSTGDVYPMPLIPRGEAYRYENSTGSHWRAPHAFAQDATGITILPTPSNPNGSIRIRFLERAGFLVEASRGSPITDMDAGVSFKTDGPGALGGSGNKIVDIRSSVPPFAARARGITVAFDGLSDYATAPPDGLALGDYLTLAEEAVVVPLPDLLHDALGTGILIHVYHALGHAAESKGAKQDFAQELVSARQLMEPRAGDKPGIVISRNHSLRRGRI